MEETKKIESMNIYEKLSNITNEIKAVAKNLDVGVGKNAYKAVGEADVLKAVRELEYKYRIYSYPGERRVIDSAILETEKEYQGQISRGNQLYMRLEVEYIFVNIDCPNETVKIITYGDGVDTQDKGPGKAMTYADKYALLKAYKIVTGEDPDQNPSPTNSEIKGETPKKKTTKTEEEKVDYSKELEKFIADKGLDKLKICTKYKLNKTSKQEDFKNALLNLKVEVGE